MNTACKGVQLIVQEYSVYKEAQLKGVQLIVQEYSVISAKNL